MKKTHFQLFRHDISLCKGPRDQGSKRPKAQKPKTVSCVRVGDMAQCWVLHRSVHFPIKKWEEDRGPF
jgi:hypothetical protein